MSDLRTAAQQALEALEYDNPAGRSATIRALRAALAQQADTTDPGHDVDVLREHVRHLERRIRELHAQQAEPLNLSDPAVQKRLALQWGYVPAAAQAEPDHETRAELAEQQVVQLAEERDHYRNLWQKAQQAEPVAWMVYTEGGTSAYVTDNPTDLVGAYRALPLYTAPPQRRLVPLTEEEIERIGMKHVTLRKVIRAVERAHGIKE